MENKEVKKLACPDCEAILKPKKGPYGAFVVCDTADCGFKCSLNDDGTLKLKIKHSDCPKCGKSVFLKEGKFGKYLSCEDYAPKNSGPCNYTAQIDENGNIKEKQLANVVPNIKCPKCSKPIVKRTGQYGGFFTCSGYPDCKTTTDEKGNLKEKGKKKK